MHFDAYSAFNEGEEGGNSGGWEEKVRESEKEGRKQDIPIGHTSDGALLKLHHVAGQRSRLVRENVLHLNKFKQKNIVKNLKSKTF